MSISIRPVTGTDIPWVNQFIIKRWGAAFVVARGLVYKPAELPGFIALLDERPAGLLTYTQSDHLCGIITLDSEHEKVGIGSALVDALISHAKNTGCIRLQAITTNDNLHALSFYQKRGFRLAALHKNAIETTRKIKPGIPVIGQNDIPIRDEIELELILSDA